MMRRPHRAERNRVLSTLAVALLVGAFAAPALAQTAYVSNNSHTSTSGARVSSAHWQGQAFTTGSESGGYALGSIGLRTTGAVSSTTGLTVKIYTVDSSELPDSLLYTLTNASSINVSSDALFTAPNNATLAESTTYIILLEGSGSFNHVFSMAEDGDENSGLSAGWSIRDNRHYRAGSGGSWASSGDPLLISVYPPETTTSTDATLSALALKDASDDSAVTLTPTFAAATTAYTASVANAVDQITVTLTTGDANATVAWLDETDATLTDADAATNDFQIDFDVGVTAFKVKVTAADTTTTQTYTVTVTRAAGAPAEQTVADDWSLKPSGLGAGDKFRLIFASSGTRDATPTAIGTYNTWVQEQAKAGHTDIQDYSAGFRVVGCTADDDARDNTATTHNASDRGVPIYWLNGTKVVDDYQDFYDGSWDDEANAKDESGSNRSLSGDSNYPFTGCGNNGREAFFTSTASRALGKSQVRVGIPNSSSPDHGPLSSSANKAPGNSRPFYGLSGVFEVADATLSALALEDALDNAVTLTPTFDAATTAYTASVANAVDEITVTPTTGDANATVAWLDGTDATLADADDVAAGFQVDLGEGDTVFKVKVTAADTTTTQTYTVTVTRAAAPPAEQTVADDWNLKPSGLGAGDKFRLIFASSGTRNANPTAIGTYNTWVQEQAKAGHTDIQDYSAGFRVVGCTEDDDARDNTATRHDASDRGVPIYWLNGNKVADQYQDFYDGSWDDEVGSKDESGSARDLSSTETVHPFTGCRHNGRESFTTSSDSRALGVSEVRVGTPNSFTTDSGPLSGTNTRASGISRPFYGLSGVFEVADATLSTLELKDASDSAVTLTPTFDAATTTYTASVANAVDEITVTPTTGDTNATVTWLDGSDATLTDADDVADGFQVDLGVGDTVFKVKVTAEDTTSTQTYTVTVTRAAPVVTADHYVRDNWSLKPSGLVIGDKFRLIFASSTTHLATSAAIADYNTFVQGAAAAGFTDIQAYSTGFRVVGCTEDDDARDNTATTFTSSDKGVPIYWLNGNKVADDYDDFYDESWDDESGSKDESGSDRDLSSSDAVYPFTGCKHNGTEDFAFGDSRALGSSDGNAVRVGRPNSTVSGDGPLSGQQNGNKNTGRPFYGLSGVFAVTIASTDATLSALALNDASDSVVTLTPVFNAATTAYTALVANTVDEITVTPTTGHVSATVAWLDGSDATLDDADSVTDGFQVDLDVGDTVFKVKVTAEDTTSTQTYTVTVTRLAGVVAVDHTVLNDWSLKPSGLGVDDKFRLIFGSTTKRDATSATIGDYNTFVQELVKAEGHTDIQAFSAGFQVVGCTGAVDARDNTATTYTSGNNGVPIYWLNGSKVADDYADFYDGTWDDEANPKSQKGTNRNLTNDTNRPFTGCKNNGTAGFSSGTSRALGTTQGTTQVAVGNLNSTVGGYGPLAGSIADQTVARTFYGLSGVFRVGTTIPNATGAPSINGTPQVDQMLTAEAGDMADTDGLPATTFPDGYKLQWARVSGGTEIDIPGATSQTYTPVDADVGNTLKVKVSFTDGSGGEEALMSAATEAVAAKQADCATDRADSDWCTTLTVESDPGGTGTSYGYRSNNYGALGDTSLDDGGTAYTIQGIWMFDSDDASDYVHIKFADGRVAYGVAFNLGGATFTAAAANEHSTDDDRYRWDRPADLVWIDGQFVTVSADTHPSFVSGEVNGTSLEMTFSQNLDTNSVPAASQFSVDVDAGGGVAPSSVTVSGKTVTLTLATAVTDDQTVKVSYTKPTSNPLQDATLGLDAPGFTDEVVQNSVSIEAEYDTIGAGLDNLEFTLTRTITARAQDVTVTLTQDEDWLETADLIHTVSFAAGSAEVTLTIRANKFSFTPTAAGDLTATVSGTGIKGGEETVAVISTADPPITLTLDKTSYTFAENAAASDVVINLIATLDAAYPRGPTSSFNISTSTFAGTAESPEDYFAFGVQGEFSETDFTRTVNTDPWVATKPLEDSNGPFRLRDDDVDEDDETLVVKIEQSPGFHTGLVQLNKSDGSVCVLGPGCDGEWPVTITDDDDAPVLGLTGSVSSIAEEDDDTTMDVAENAVTLTVASTNGKIYEDDQTLTLTFGGSATYGTHYQVTPADADAVAAGHQVALPGEPALVQAIKDEGLEVIDGLPLIAPTVELTVTATANNSFNGDRTIQVTGARDGTAFGATVTVTIVDDDVSATALVSNTHLSRSNGSDNFLAQSFETGDHAAGYTVADVQIHVTTGVGKTHVVVIREDDSGSPGANNSDIVATLTNPSSFTDSAFNTFTAPAATALDAETTYWLSVNEGVASGARANYSVTSGNGQTGASGWTIGDDLLFRSSETANWSTDTTALRFGVNGTLVGVTPASIDATLSALALKDASDSAVTLTPVFAAATTAYTASVANAVDEITVTPTTGDTNATVAWLDGSDATLADADDVADGFQVDLGVGDTVFKVKVTAEDTTTTQTYTVTVTRASTAVTVTAIEFTNEPSDGTYNLGEIIEVSVTFSGSVDVTGTPRVKLRMELGTQFDYADYAVGASTDDKVLVFRHTVTGAWDDIPSPNGIQIPLNGLELNGGTIRNKGTTVNATLDHGLITGLPKLTRLVESIEVTSTPAVPAADTGGVAIYGPGETIEFTVTFGDTVAVSGAPQLKFNLRLDEYDAAYAGGADTSTLRFEWTVPDSFAAFAAITILSNFDAAYALLDQGLVLNGAALTDSGGRVVNIRHGLVRPTVSVDRAPPVLWSSAGGATVNGTQLELTYREEATSSNSDRLDTDSTPAPGDYTPTVAGTVVAVSEVEVVDRDTVQLTLAAPVRRGDTVTLAYTPGTDPIQDLWGNTAAALSARSVRNDTVVDTTAPVVSSATVNGASLVITFDEALAAAANLANDAFAVKKTPSGGSAEDVSLSGAPTISGVTVSLTLASPVTLTDTVTVSYEVPTTNNANRLEDASGNEVADFTQSVTNNTGVTNRAPTFDEGASTTRSVAENTPFGTNIGSAVAATDADGDTLTYTLEGTDAAAFGIDAASGQLKTAAALDFEDDNSYSVTVKVVDTRNASDTIAVTINVTDEREPPAAPTAPTVNPTAGNPTRLVVRWGAPTNSGPPVTDYDVRYQRTGGVWVDVPHEGDGTTATLTGLTRDTQYEVQVLARNAEGASAWSASGRGRTADVAPVGLHMQSVTVHEGETARFTITFPPAVAGDRLQWYTHGVEAYPGRDFRSASVDVTLAAGATQVTGEVETYFNEATEREERIELPITYESGANAQEFFSGFIYIRDGASNAAPVFDEGLEEGGDVTRWVYENTPPGPLGRPVAATDSNGDTLSYALSGPDAALFEIDWRTGQLSARVALDHETAASRTVRVAADDGHGGTVAVDVTVNVLDVKEQPGTPAAPTVTATAGTTDSLDVAWTAPDLAGGPALTDYRLCVAIAGSAQCVETLVAGTATWTTLTELRADTRYAVEVQARNEEHGWSEWSPLGYGRTRANAGPVFREGVRTTRTVLENTAQGQAVGIPVAALDVDDDPLTYTLDGADAAAFTIDRRTGQVRTHAALDFETKYRYAVTVQAEDSEGGGTATIAVTIIVTDVREAPAPPLAPTVAGGETSVAARWGAPSVNTGPPVTAYDLRYRQTGGSWRNGPQGVAGTTATVSGLATNTAYEVQVRARSAEGTSAWSASGHGRTATGARTVRMDDVTVYEGETARFTIVFTPARSSEDYVGWYTLDLEATAADGDFGKIDRLIYLTAGATRVTGEVETYADDKVEGTESLRIFIGFGTIGDEVDFVGNIYILDGPRVAAQVAGDPQTRPAASLDAGSTPAPPDAVVERDPMADGQSAPDGRVAMAEHLDDGMTPPAPSHTTVRIPAFDEVVTDDDLIEDPAAMPMLGGTPASEDLGDIAIDADDPLQGPVAIRVADTNVEEAVDAELNFEVTLDRASPQPVTVDYTTAAGTATANADYATGSGTLTFEPGETTKTVPVPVFDDAHNDGGETMRLTLSNPTGATFAGGEPTLVATGTINNTDPMPLAWLARFGRVASDHALQAIEGRWRDGTAARPANRFTLGGRDARELFAFADLGDRFSGRGNASLPGPHLAPPATTIGLDAVQTQHPADGNFTDDHFATDIDVFAALGEPDASGTDAPGASDIDPRVAARGAVLRALGWYDPRTLGDLREVLMGSSFFYGRPAGQDGARREPGWLGDWAAWGETTATRFSGADGALNLQGEVATGTVGADSHWGRWHGGVALSYTEGDGMYRQAHAGGGAVRSTLMSVHPFARAELTPRASVWGVLGYGAGTLYLTPLGADEPIHTALASTMAAFGARGTFAARTSRLGAFELAVVSDARMSDTASTAVAANLVGATGATHRVRLLLEGSGELALSGDSRLRPTLEAGLRYDGGDAETGAGVELGTGLGYATGRLEVRLSARTLVVHRDAAFTEAGYSSTLSYRPDADGLGLSMELGVGQGNTSSGVQSLWAGPDAYALTAGTRMDTAPHLQATFGYGFAGRKHGRAWRPYVATQGLGTADQALTLGLDFTAGTHTQAGLELGQRRNGDADAEQAIRLTASIHW